MRSMPCVIGVADHAGWAHVVCVAAESNVPAVIERRRVATIADGLPTMPYHHESLGMREDEANALSARVRRSIAGRTSRALRRSSRIWHRRIALLLWRFANRHSPTCLTSSRWYGKRINCNAPPME